LLHQIATSLDAANHTAAVQLANVPDEIRGYGHVKEKSIAAARELQEQRLRAFKNPLPGKVAA
jgi:indolepyruvate ferredoxin oxidoreductase